MSRENLIPQPKTYGPLGNLPQIDLERPVQSIMKLCREYGPIFRMDLPGRSEIFLSGHELAAEVCDQNRFDKKVWAPLQKVRAFTGDGLFTSGTEEPNWRKAHDILLPTFSQRAMQGYHDMMADLALQLVQKWSRLNPDENVEVPEDMTRLTLDTIGLCGFHYRFNSFYRETPHPFIVSMIRALHEAMSQLHRLDLHNKLLFRTKRLFKQDIQTMFSLVDKIIADRRKQGHQGGTDLLSRMLEGKDPKTGEGLDDENIRYQIITFLIAGHETTSGLLSFALYFLLKHPDKLRKGYEEAARVLTSPVPTYAQVRNLTYIRMILNEALRLWPTAPAFSLEPKEDTVLAGKYALKKGESVIVFLPMLHRDAEAWGDDAEQFRPERFEEADRVPRHAFKPFGNGQRACIGQQFALHEATLVLGMILKHFELIDHTDYQLKIKETLTLKPDGFTMRVRPRRYSEVFHLTGQETASPEEVSQGNTAFIQHEDQRENLTQNGPELVDRVLLRFGLNGREFVEVGGGEEGTAGQLPPDRSARVSDALHRSVGLQEPATLAQIQELAAYTVCPPHKRELEALLQEEAYSEKILLGRVSMLKLLEQYPACELPFERFMKLLPQPGK